jgi:iron complex outermembrane recepter protein
MNIVRPCRLSTAVCSALLLSLLPLAAVAQDPARQLDRVDVTGSRIKKAQIEGQAPVQTITRQQIEKSGLSSVADILQQLTGAGSALNTKFNSSGNFGFPPDGAGVGAGSATVDLRHLGSKRVLVLVDGVRWVNEASASGVSASTDLNTIPVNIIERIDVLEDGASSIYGSDAIAGVVNIITRRNFDGVAVSTSYGEYDEGDGQTSTGEFSFGKSGDGFSFFLGASYLEQKAIESKNRAISRLPVPGTGLAFGSSATPTGRFIFTDPNTGRFADITLDRAFPSGRPLYNPDAPGVDDDFHRFGNDDRFNFAEYNYLLTPSKRKGVFAQGRYDLGDNVTWYTRLLYNQRESENRAAAEPLFLGPLWGIGNPWADNFFVSADNPFNPFGFDLASSGANANLLGIGRRPLEGGPRRFFQDVDTWYFATGLEGSFDTATRVFYWDLNYVRSSNRAEQTNYGSYNIRRVQVASGLLADCTAPCVPLNLFGGPGSITRAMLDYIQPVVRDSSENNLQLLSANLSGDLADLWAGPLAFATGYEHRRLDGSYWPDALTVAGEYNGVPSLPTAGRYDVDEYFLELSLPLYATAGSQLDVSLAARYSDYSTFGGETTGKAGFRWQFGDQLLLRGTAAEGFRAPSIGELKGSLSRFDAVISDPCANAAAADRANCAALGVPLAYMDAAQPNPQIAVITGGNEALTPERADSYTLGLVWSPAFGANTGWSERLDVELTWYRHKLTDAIEPEDAQFQLNECVRAPSAFSCAGITRNATGAIARFDNQLTNLGVIETEGFDIDLFWTLPPTDAGTFRVAWQNTLVDAYRRLGVRNPATGQRQQQPQGVGVEVNNSAIPEWTSTLALDWVYGDLSARLSSRHIDRLTESCGRAWAFAVCSDPDPVSESGSNRLGSTTYHDLQVAWQTPWWADLRLTAGVNNLGGKEPPLCLSCSLNGYDASTYDLPGRFYYLRADLKF